MSVCMSYSFLQHILNMAPCEPKVRAVKAQTVLAYVPLLQANTFPKSCDAAPATELLNRECHGVYSILLSVSLVFRSAGN